MANEIPLFASDNATNSVIASIISVKCQGCKTITSRSEKWNVVGHDFRFSTSKTSRHDFAGERLV